MTRVLSLFTALIFALVSFTGTAAAQVGKPVTIVDANAATEAELAKIPGLNANIARAIVAQRPFASVTALDRLLTMQGLTRAQLTDLYGRLFVHINLNSATREEMQLIPNMGPRMMGEFEEYRPYANLAVFRREIGKYVNQTELARLEQYVFVPINLNTASDADILTIPGLGQRMLREFKEYRPYKEMAQFRREIGKYVDAKEVARFERYVTIN
jgi:DNA uptake protein ComE-like DNA-binding protein